MKTKIIAGVTAFFLTWAMMAVATLGPQSVVTSTTNTITLNNGTLMTFPAAAATIAPALSIPLGTATFAIGSNVTSVACATSYSCNNTRGTLTIVGGTATTGTIATVSFSAAIAAAPACFAKMNGGAATFDIGTGVPSTTAFTITAGLTVVGATFNVDYWCQP